MPSISLGRKEQLYVVAETSYGEAAAPAGSGAIKHLNCTMQLKDERADRSDRKSTRGLAERVAGRRNVEWSVDGYLVPSGTSATAPDISALLECSFAKRTTNAAVVLSEPTENGAILGSSGSLRIGDFVGFELGGGFYAACIIGVDPETSVVSWWPPLPSAPEVGATVRRSVNYRLRTDPQGSVTIHRCIDQEAQAVSGCVPNEWTWSFAAGDPAKVTISGFGADTAFAGAGSLYLAMDDAQLSFEYAGVPVYEPGTWVQIDDEALKVTAVDADSAVCTVLRAQCGTSAQAHDASAAIAPYRPAPATAGSPVTGVNGRCFLDDIELKITSARLTVTENVSLLNNLYGSVVAADYHYPQNRSVKLDAESFLTGEMGCLPLVTKTMSAAPFFLQSGNAVGQTFVLFAPKFQPEIPEIEAPADGVVPLALTGPALEEAGEDEVFIAFL